MNNKLKLFLIVVCCLLALPFASAKIYFIEGNRGIFNNTINGSPICTQDNGYCAGQATQGGGVANRIALWKNTTHVTSDADLTFENNQLRVQGGDGAEPGYNFQGYSGTGMFSGSQEYLGLTVDEFIQFELAAGTSGENYGTRITAASASDPILTLKHAGVSTSNYLDLRNTADSLIGQIDVDGNIGIGIDPTYEIDIDRGASTAYLRMEGDPPVLWMESETYNSGQRPGFYIKDNNVFRFSTNGGQNMEYDFFADFANPRSYDALFKTYGSGTGWTQWLSFQHDGTDGVIDTGDGDLTLNSASNDVNINGRTIITSQASASIGLVVKGAAAQSANLQQWQDSIGTVKAYMDKDGILRDDDRLQLSGKQTGGTAYGMVIGALSYGDNSGSASIALNPYAYPQLNYNTHYGTIRLTRIGRNATNEANNITNFYNVFDRVDMLSGYDGEVTNLIYWQANPPNMGSASATNLYAIKINNLAQATNNYAIHTGSDGLVHFGDDVDMDKDLLVDGNITGNLHYGEMYIHNEANDETPLDAANTYNNVTESMTVGELNGFSYFNGTLTVLVAGVYQITSHQAFSGTANQEYHSAVGVNGVEQDKCHTARVIGTGADVGASAIGCLLNLAINDEVTLMTENEDSAGSPTFTDVNFRLVRIGG